MTPGSKPQDGQNTEQNRGRARGSGRGRGRPPVFTDTQRALYLQHVTAGMALADAAAMVGITRQWAARLAHTDPEFGRARDDAIQAGRAARWEGKPHDEYRYIHGGCRCTLCRKAASNARAERRATAGADTGGGTHLTAPTVIPMPTRDMRSDQPLHSLRAVS